MRQRTKDIKSGLLITKRSLEIYFQMRKLLLKHGRNKRKKMPVKKIVVLRLLNSSNQNNKIIPA